MVWIIADDMVGLKASSRTSALYTDIAELCPIRDAIDYNNLLHTLTIPRALPEDKGLYIVRAVNTGGVAHCGADVVVEEKSAEEIEIEEAEIREEKSAAKKGDIVITPTGQLAGDKAKAGTKSDKMQAPSPRIAKPSRET
nr:uncharacterized protein LOC129263889 [Lytechinus pictus]